MALKVSAVMVATAPQAPASGERNTVLKLGLNQSKAVHTGNFKGEAKVKVSWRFEPAVN